MDRGFDDPDNVQMIRDLRKDSETVTGRLEYGFSPLESAYRTQGNKKTLQELEPNFPVLAERRRTIAQRAKKFSETVTKKKQIKRKRPKESSTTIKEGTQNQGGLRRSHERGQFKEPTGQVPEKISREYSPLMAGKLANEMRLYIKRCANLDSLAYGEQRTIGKRYVDNFLWREVQPAKSDNLAAIVKKVEEAFYTIVPTFIRR